MRSRLLALVTVLGLLAPLSAATAAGGKVARLGFVSMRSGPSDTPHLDAFRQGLRELGYVAGRDVTIEARYAQGNQKKLPDLVAELIRLKVDILVTQSGVAALAATGAFASAGQQRIEALVVLDCARLHARAAQIVDLAMAHRLPALYPYSIYPEAGGLMSYGPDLRDGARRAAGYVDKILKGARPADLPVEQPTKFELIVNLTTAKALSLPVPQSVLVRADQVIQ
jgi:ABC-type uncharacterized transport system substrate-binding protein